MSLGTVMSSVTTSFSSTRVIRLPQARDGYRSVFTENVYRRFFIGAIVIALTAGATWGAVLLWQIGIAGKFTSASIHQVNAHGHAQIFGWVGLFIMGFAYQIFPRLWDAPL